MKWASLFLVFLLAGCIPRFDPDAMQLRADSQSPPIFDTRSVGQSFVATRPNLTAIELEIAALPDSPGKIILHLRANPNEATDLARGELPIPPTDQSTLHWQFSPIADSINRSYYLLIETPDATADRPLRLRSVAHEVYGAGTVFENDRPVRGDLKFLTFYDYDAAMFWNDFAAAAHNFWLLIPFLMLFFAPGFLALEFAPMLRDRFDGWEQAALSIGFSLAIVPFALLWMTQLGGALSAATAWLFFGASGTVAVVIIARRLRDRGNVISEFSIRNPQHLHRRAKPPRGAQDQRSPVGVQVFAIRNFLPLILLFGFAARLIAVRDLALPAWVDSVHHTLLARIIAETGRIPSTYEPFIATPNATYHFGFHALIASFAWLSGKSITDAILMVGQLFNVAMALQIYLFTRWMTRRRGAAILAAFIVALLSTMPAYYVSWGRYTQLNGLIILPVACVLSIEAVRHRDKRVVSLSLVTLSGLMLTHYRVFAFYICFLAAWGLVEFARQPREWKTRLIEMTRMVILWIIAIVLLMPWLFGPVTDLWLRVLRESQGVQMDSFWNFDWGYVVSGFDRYIMTLAILGGVVALIKRESFAAVIFLWGAILLLATNPWLIRLPGSGMINNVSMLIAWFMPLAILCGYLFDEIGRAWFAILKGKWRGLGYAVVTLAIIALGIVGFYRQVTILSPSSVLGIAPDREAIGWLESNTPSRSRFLINAQPWNGPLYAGTDGGYWITSLAGRQTTTPPALFDLGPADQVLSIMKLDQQIEAVAKDTEELKKILQKEKIDYVYIGALGGLLDPEMLQAAPGFRLIYSNGRAFVFQVVE